MKQILGGAVIGMLLAGIVAGAIVPLLPPSVHQPWVVWAIAAAVIAASIYAARRLTKAPPGSFSAKNTTGASGKASPSAPAFLTRREGA